MLFDVSTPFRFAAAGAVSVALAFGSVTLMPAADADADQYSPLGQWHGFGHDEEADMARYRSEFAAREAIVAACMREHGVPYIERRLVSTPDESSSGTLGFEVVDPNIDAAEGLADADRENYFMALIGRPDDTGEALDRELLDVNNDGEVDYLEKFGPGCSGDAHRAIPGVFAAKAVLTEQFLDLRRQVEDDEAVQRAEASWLACIASDLRLSDLPLPLEREAVLDHLDATGQIAEEATSSVVNTCNDGYRSARAEAVSELEEAFVAENEATLTKFGIRRAGGK